MKYRGRFGQVEKRGIEPGGFRNQTLSILGRSRDFQYVA